LNAPSIGFARRTALLLALAGTLAAAFLFAPVTRVSGSSMPLNVGVVLKSVVFLYYPTATGFEVGTGFLVDIPSKTDPKRSSVVIVTARHLVDPKWEGCGRQNPRSIFARVNVKNFKLGQEQAATDQIPLDLGEGSKTYWYKSPNDLVDIAIIPLSESTVAQFMKDDVHLLPVADFATKAETEHYNVGIGDPIVTAGLVPALLTTERNYPAFKFGHISNIPQEPIEMICEKGDKPLPRDVWLLAGNFVGGNSGSPVFLLPPVPSAAHRVMLIGIIAGSIPDVDLGQMVPSEYVFDVIQAHYPSGNMFRGRTANSIMK
jgi:hypothetical protein